MSVYMTLFCLWISHFLIDMMIGIYSVYKTMMGMDLAAAGVILSVSAWIGEGSQIIWGPLSDRGYRKHLVLLGLALTAASALLGYVGAFWTIFPLVLLTYIGSASYHPCAAGLAGSLNSSRRGLYVAIYASGGALGLAASQTIFYHIHSTFDGHVSVLIIPSVMLILALLLLPNGLDTPVKAPKAAFSFGQVLGLFKDPHMRILYGVQVTSQTLLWGTVFLLPDVLLARGCEDWITFGGGHLAFILGGGLMMIPGGMLADRFSPRIVMLVGTSLGLLLFYYFLLVPAIHPFVVLSTLVCLGACWGMVHPVGLSLGNRLYPETPGLVSAFLMGMVWCISESAGPSSGALTKLFEGPSAPAQALQVMGLLGTISVVCAWRLPILEREKQGVLA